MLVENTLFGIRDKVQIAIDRLREFEPQEGYYLAFSGGKDSVCIYHLAKMAGVKFEAHYNLTTVDPPELVYFIRKSYPEVEVHRPNMSMWQLIEKMGTPPTRISRYCCRVLKEGGGSGRLVITGVRWQESVKRSKRRMVETCYKDKTKTFLNVIVDWSEADVWQFIKENNIPYCSLYDEGFTRLGCIGCPMAGKNGMLKEFERWPPYRANYIRAFEKMIVKRISDGKRCDWKTGEEVLNGWINGYRAKGIPDQTIMFE